MQFKDVYSYEFLSEFGEHINEISTIPILPEAPYINLERVLRIIDIPLVTSPSRFDTAYQLGLKLLNPIHISPSELSSQDLAKYKHVAAQGFAKELLMPRKLLVKIARNYIDAHRLDPDQLNRFNTAKIIQYLADELAITPQLMQYRVRDIDLFI